MDVFLNRLYIWYKSPSLLSKHKHTQVSLTWQAASSICAFIPIKIITNQKLSIQHTRKNVRFSFKLCNSHFVLLGVFSKYSQWNTTKHYSNITWWLRRLSRAAVWLFISLVGRKWIKVPTLRITWPLRLHRWTMVRYLTVIGTSYLRWLTISPTLLTTHEKWHHVICNNRYWMPKDSEVFEPG